jgi:hypothetical protein
MVKTDQGEVQGEGDQRKIWGESEFCEQYNMIDEGQDANTDGS